MQQNRPKQSQKRPSTVLTLCCAALLFQFSLFKRSAYVLKRDSIGIRYSDLARTARLMCKTRSAAQMNSLRSRAEGQPEDCASWLLLSLLKVRAGCSVEPQILLQQGLRMCSIESKVLRLQMAVFLNWLNRGATRAEMLTRNCFHLYTSATCTTSLAIIVAEDGRGSPSLSSRSNITLSLQQHESFSHAPIHKKMEHILRKHREKGAKAVEMHTIPDMIHFVFGMDSVRRYAFN